MSTNKPPKKKVVVTAKPKSKAKVNPSTKATASSKTKAKSTVRSKRTAGSKSATQSRHGAELIFNRQQIMIMLGGLVLIIIGLAFMSGGSMPDPNTWDESVIYSGRRLTLAPILILLGLGVEIYAIFKK